MKFLVFTLVFTSLFAYSVETKDQEKKESSILGALIPGKPSKNQMLGEILKGVLENYHLTKKELGNDVSKEAFKLYIERLDYGKQFLLEDDVEAIEKYEKDFDNQLISGNLVLVKETSKVLKKRIRTVKAHVEKTLKKEMSFDKNETYESDPEKREFVSSEKDLLKRWDKMLKLEVLVQYFDLKDEQDGVDTKKDKKKEKKKKKKVAKDKKEKKKSKKELMTEAREKVAKRYSRIFKRLLDEKDTDEVDKFYNSVSRVYDPHTLYLVPEEKEDFDIDMSGKLEGIGALLREEGSFIKVERIIPGSASWKGKELKAEDTILAVGQKKGEFVDIVDMGIREAVKLIRGPKGSTVFLKVKKPEGITQTIAIVRDEVVLEESYVKSSLIQLKDHGPKVGYIKVPKFYRDFQNPNGRNCSDDVKKELIKLNATDAQAVILDLRNNGGGALVDATLMAGLFIDKGPIVQVKRSGSPDIKYDDDNKTYWDKELIVLVNRFSASASEIVAGAIKDYNRGIVIGSGEQTHGKGTVQAILNLDEFVSNRFMRMDTSLGAMKITTDMFYRINGMSTQFRGVEPDVKLPDPYGFMETGEKSLDHAIPYAEVNAAKYEPLKKPNWKKKLSKILSNSSKRVKKDERFQNIIKSVEWSKKRKDQTQRPLNFDKMQKFRKETREMAKKFENDKVNKKVLVENLGETKKMSSEEDKERFKEYKEGLQKDPVIEETLNIVNEIVKS